MGIAGLSFLRRTGRVAVGRHGTIGRPPSSRREQSGAGIGLALTATFMGILLVRSMADAAELPSSARAALPANGDEALGSSEIVCVDGWGSAQTIGTTGPLGNVGSASVFGAGAFIDPVALAKLSGNPGSGGDGEISISGTEPGEQNLATLSSPTSFTGNVDISFGDVAGLPEIPGLQMANDDENAGPIGDVIVGTDGDDTIVGTDDNDVIEGGDGNDDISGLDGDDSIEGGAGDDIVDGGAGNDEVLGEEGNDTLDGGSGDDIIDGGIGDDQLQGGDGRDDLDGGVGNDSVDGGAGNDELAGGVGDDSIQIDRPGDLVVEDPWGVDFGGNDTLVVAPDFGAQLEKAFPTLAKGGVTTFMVGDSVVGPVPTGANSFKSQVAPNVENVRLTGTEAHDVVGDGGANAIEGNDGSNLLWGGKGDDQIRGAGADDRLYGETGDDLLLGDAGNDWLDGGEGSDQLYGGAGDDVFVLGLAEDAATTVFDQEGSNRLMLKGGQAGNLSAALEGEDLHLDYAGREIAIIKSYAATADSFAGIDLGDGKALPLDGFLASMDSKVEPLPDLLAKFMEPTADSIVVEDTGGTRADVGDPHELISALDDALSLSATFAGADLWVGGDENVGTATPRPEEQHRQIDAR